ncbi:MAG: DUF2723 domain-containing protein [Anaerolineales bacterium]|nr:DUF2723 domain-containing protein [Anaerolineales bacterium]
MVSNLASERQTPPQILDRLVGAGIALAAFLLYLSTLAPTVLEADGGEFQFVPWLPGIAHPTGYPLYVLLGWLWTHLLPLGEVAWRMNLLSAVLAAIAVGLTYGVARQLLDRTLPDSPVPARILAAAVSAASFAASHTFWSQAVMAEVYALHALFVAAILWLALRYRFTERSSAASDSKDIPPRFAGRNDMAGKLLALTIGLSLTHHRTVVLLLPALALFLMTADRTPSPALPLLGGGREGGPPILHPRSRLAHSRRSVISPPAALPLSAPYRPIYALCDPAPE